MPQNAPAHQRFFAELKRRKVFKVAAVYGAAAFVILQIADLVFEPLGLPDWTITFLILMVAFGFPIALILAWAFDLTPDGVKKTEDAAPGEISEIISAPAHKRWPSGILALAGVIMLAIGGWLTVRSTGARGASDTAAATGVEAPAGTQLASLTRASDDGRRTIAVLPFENMSGTAEAEPFTVGVHDDVLTQLSKIGALKVTSRTSVKEYKDTEKSIPEIAAELGVETVLEGGVQRAGNQVRINVQLIDPATDEHLWAETYDAELTAENVFSIQSEIAQSVADALEAELSPDEIESLDAIPTRNLDALAAYHAGGLAFEARGSGASDSAGVAALERAVALDPDFAAAWAKLAMMISWQANIGTNADTARAIEAIARAEALASGSADVEMARGYFKYYAERDFDAALEHFRAADRLQPSDAEATAAIGLILRRLGDWEGSAEYSWRAIELDPRNVGLYDELVETMAALRRWKTADAVIERGLIVQPADPELRGWKLFSLVALDRDAARASSYSAELSLGDQSHMGLASARAQVALEAGDPDEAIRLVQTAALSGPFDDWLRLLTIGTAERSRGNMTASREAGEILRPKADKLPARAGFRDGTAALARALMSDTAVVPGLAASARAEALASDPVDAPQGLYFAAQALTFVGEQTAAAEILLHLSTVPANYPTVAHLTLSPVWAGLRASPEWPAVRAAFEAAEAEGARLDAEAGF